MKHFYTPKWSIAPAAFFKSLFVFLFLTGLANLASAQLVFNQIYAGDGTTDARYNAFLCAFVEPANKKPVSLKGLSVQFYPASAAVWQATILPDLTLAPGKSFIISETVNSQGTSFVADLPNTNLELITTGGSVVLIEQTTQLTC